MKIIEDDGVTEHEVPKTREAAIELIRRLVPDARLGRKEGHHVERLQSGGFRYKYVDRGEAHFGPSRATFDEAAEDYVRLLAGDPLAPVTVGQGSPQHRERQREAHRKWYEAVKAAAADGKVHLKPPTCSGCQEVGHKVNYCPQRGWKRATKVGKPRAPKVARPPAPTPALACTFCSGTGHTATSCAKRRHVLAERARRAGTWAA